MFDDLLELIDGSITITGSLDDAPSSTTIDSDTGARVIDLGTGGTPASGLTVVLICPEITSSAETLVGYLEASDAEAFGSAVEYLGKFGVANVSSGTILASETPCVATIRFITKKQYVRANITVSASFGAIRVLIVPHVFKLL